MSRSNETTPSLPQCNCNHRPSTSSHTAPHFSSCAIQRPSTKKRPVHYVTYVFKEHSYEITDAKIQPVIVAVTLYSRLQEMHGSNLSRNMGNVKFFWFSSVSPSKCCGSTYIRPRPLPFKSFPIHRPHIILPFDAMQCSHCQRRKITT
jgi:hypothetical protein